MGLGRARIAAAIVGATTTLILLALPSGASAQEQIIDLELAKNDSPDPVKVADQLTYTLTVSNPALVGLGLGATITDTLPDSVKFVSASEGCAVEEEEPMGGTVICSDQLVLLPGGSEEFEIVVLPGVAGEIENTAMLEVALLDVNEENNTDTTTTTVQPAPPEAITPNLRITKTDRPDPIQRGKRLTYRLTATNVKNAENGTDNATDVKITDRLPESVEFVSASAGCTEAEGTVTCEVGDLDEGKSAQRRIVVRPTRAGRIVNRASVSSETQVDPAPRDNRVRERTLVSAIPVRRCGGETPTRFGTHGDDMIVGTPRRDVIDVGRGDDVVRGLRGSDKICGRFGDDRIKGGSGRDLVSGGGGADVIRGNAGSDLLLGRKGPDTIRGSRGDDRLFGNPGNDVLNGGPGTDRCRSGRGRDTVTQCEG